MRGGENSMKNIEGEGEFKQEIDEDVRNGEKR